MISIKNLVIVILSVFTLTSCFDYEDVEFKGMEGFNIEERNENNLTVRLDMKVDNPNDYNITVKKSTLDIYLNGKYVGKTKMQNPIKLKKRKEGIYPVYLKTNGSDLMKVGLGSLGGLMGGNLKVRLKGDVKAKAYGIGKTFPIDVEEPVSLKGIFG